MLLVIEEEAMELNIIGVFYGVAQLQRFAKEQYSIKELKLIEYPNAKAEEYHGCRLKYYRKSSKHGLWYIYQITINPTKELALEECRSWRLTEEELESLKV